MSTIFRMIKSLKHIYPGSLKREKVINSIRDNWGKEINKDRKFNLISIYYKLIRETDSAKLVDENTWNDLNMDSVFSLIDRNMSTIGSQYLYNLLHKYDENSETLSGRYDQYKYFSVNKNIREKILVHLHKLRHNYAYYIPNLIFQEVSKRPKLYFLFYLLSFVILLSVVLIYYNPVFVFVSLSLAIINFCVNFFYGRKISGYFVEISYLSTMLRVGIKLATLDDEIPQIKELKKLKEFSTSVTRKISWFIIDKSRLDVFLSIIVDYFNYFALFNIVSFVHSIQYIRTNQDKLKRVYELIGSLDTNIAIASYLKNIPHYCYPEFNREKTISAKGIYHPLLKNPIVNDFYVQDKSVLITGSNMAGKTTFIKTVGLNIILSRSISICLAKEANLPKCIVKSSIQRADDINENKSYYFKEIEMVLDFMNMSSGQDCYMFLIDEIFRGTNTIERIAAATSVLKYLATNNISFVTTHDIELQKLLDESFEMYHFCEQVDGEKHYFDYHIKSGPTSSRNAIKLLKLKGYPESVVSEANDLAKQFTLTGKIEKTLL